MRQPKILLADEPTSALDPKIGFEVMDLIRELSEERDLPIIVSVHNVGIAKRFSDRIIGMRDGRKVFDEKTSAIDDRAISGIYEMHGEEASDVRS